MGKKILFWLSLALLLVSLYLVFVYVPTEKEMGIVQRIFYLMVPMGWLAMLAFFIVFICSIFFLARKEEKWDIRARSSAEVGFVFTTLALIAGSLWAKPIWGVWWDWGTPRLVSTLVLWIIYLSYFMVRSLATDESRGATFSAVVGIVGFVDLPIIALSTTLWRGMHPGALIFEGGLAPEMSLTLMFSILTFTVFYFLILTHLVSMKNDQIEVEKLKRLHG